MKVYYSKTDKRVTEFLFPAPGSVPRLPKADENVVDLQDLHDLKDREEFFVWTGNLVMDRFLCFHDGSTVHSFTDRRPLKMQDGLLDLWVIAPDFRNYRPENYKILAGKLEPKTSEELTKDRKCTTVRSARRKMHEAFDAAHAPILDAYPSAEPLGWGAKVTAAFQWLQASEAERDAVLAETDISNPSALLPLHRLCRVLIAEAEGPTRADVDAMAGLVLDRSFVYGEISGNFSRIRRAKDQELDNAEDPGAVPIDGIFSK